MSRYMGISDFTQPGVNQGIYNSLTINQKVVLDFICTTGGGVSSAEVKEQTGIKFNEQKGIIRALISKGIQLRALETGTHTRYFYSAYAEDHKKRIGGGINNG